MISIEDKILSRIYGHKRGWVFFAVDFVDLGTRAAVDKALRSLLDRGTIRQVVRGLYDYPRVEGKDFLPFDLHVVARAIARKNKWAISILDLEKSIYESNGPKKFVKVGDKLIEFRKRRKCWGVRKPSAKPSWYGLKYGITFKQYKEMIANQQNGCAICGKNRSNGDRPLAIDHNHSTGKVRGLLCTQCNTGLGQFQDSKDLLLKAAEYLDKTDHKQEEPASTASPLVQL